MNCSDEKCGGKIDKDQKISLRISCCSFKLAHPCGVCGMVHWGDDGQPCVNRSNKKTFLKNERVVVIDNEGNEEDITDYCG